MIHIFFDSLAHSHHIFLKNALCIKILIASVKNIKVPLLSKLMFCFAEQSKLLSMENRALYHWLKILLRMSYVTPVRGFGKFASPVPCYYIIFLQMMIDSFGTLCSPKASWISFSNAMNLVENGVTEVRLWNASNSIFNYIIDDLKNA